MIKIKNKIKSGQAARKSVKAYQCWPHEEQRTIIIIIIIIIIIVIHIKEHFKENKK